ncbi:hypothetical protein BSP109_02210 [Brevibacterium sp. Mu109]|uniref:hypothetical protein n=1 Tax=Brevibacterium sp. Mu109 TaxID=1255669 RepID=UPI000C541253|nr:hypothetical protein [Brevibacterium sp. Mu109]SMX87391.1 hypothetical protein BSP109_02210 [Brevibacterium sp. Mu109]
MSTAYAPTRPAISVDELKRAWHAVQAGQFRRTNRTGPAARQLDIGGEGVGVWEPSEGEQVVALLGAAGSAGTSTVALALALAAERTARVVECGPAIASGLASASTAELGTDETGWHQGRRDRVLLERTSELAGGPASTPTPIVAAHPGQLTILDIGWEASQVLTTTSWLSTTIDDARALVMVTTATIPGFRRLDALMELLGELHPSVGERLHLAVLGPRRKKWPRGLEHAGGLATRQLLDSDRVVEIPHDRDLATTGLDSRPLPEAVLSAGAELLAQIEERTAPLPLTPDTNRPDPTVTDSGLTRTSDAGSAEQHDTEVGRTFRGFAEGNRTWSH